MGKKTTFISILILAIALRLINLNQSFWLDEASQAQLSSLSVSEIWFERGADFHPPLFYLMAHGWLKFGTSEVWLRLLPVLFGVATVYLTLHFSSKLLSPKAGLIAGFLLAVNPYHIYYSQEFRMYSLLGLLGVWSVYLLWKKSRWLFLANVLMLYTHYSSVLLLITQLLYVFSFSRKDIKWFLGQNLLAFLLYLPWFPQFLLQLQSGSNIDAFLPGWREVLSVSATKSLPLILFKFVAGRINILPRSVYLIYIIFVLAISAVAMIMARQNRKLLLTWFSIPIIGSIFLSYLVPQTQPFRLIYTLPALVIILSQAVIKFPKLFMTLLIYISVVGNMMYFTRPRLQREQWRQAIEYLNQQSGVVAVKFSDKFAPFHWYNHSLPVYPIVGNYPAKENDVRNRLSSIPSEENDIYLLEYLTGLTDPERVVEKVLQESGYKEVQTINYEGVGFIYHYQKL